jgi:hypothetical protein
VGAVSGRCRGSESRGAWGPWTRTLVTLKPPTHGECTAPFALLAIPMPELATVLRLVFDPHPCMNPSRLLFAQKPNLYHSVVSFHRALPEHVAPSSRSS